MLVAAGIGVSLFVLPEDLGRRRLCCFDAGAGLPWNIARKSVYGISLIFYIPILAFCSDICICSGRPFGYGKRSQAKAYGRKHWQGLQCI